MNEEQAVEEISALLDSMAIEVREAGPIEDLEMVVLEPDVFLSIYTAFRYLKMKVDLQGKLH